MNTYLMRRIVLILLPLLLISCDRNVLFDQSQRVDGGGWPASQLLRFNVEATDTTSRYLCCIDLRNELDYPFSNIYLSIKTVYPDGSFSADTNIEFILAQPDGKWLGRQTARYVDGRYPFAYFQFPRPGAYQFVLSHAMRDSLLPGIRDVGLHIERISD